jgi:endonuclease/exonuclease/phosphatase family metal-dependent hydrolase
VVTLNLWNRFGPWPDRLAPLRAQLAELSPDLVGLQEVVKSDDGDRLDQAALLAEGAGYHVAWVPTGPGAVWGNAVLSRWPIARTLSFPLPRGGTDEQRVLLFAEIDAPFAKVPFFVTHLNWKLHQGHVRELQVRELADRVAQLAPTSGFPPIVCGDFNAEPESDEIRFLRGLTSLRGKSVYFADAFVAAGGGGKGVTFSRKNPYAAAVREPERRLDYIFVRGPDADGRGDVLEARVCFDRPDAARVWPTDHFGVTAVLTVSPTTA